MLLKGISKSNLIKKSLIKFPLKNAFIIPEKPWTANANVDDLPPQGSDIDRRLESTKTYTKWFNPHTFDPRTPDYFETVRSEWQEDVTHEDVGERNLFFKLKINDCYMIFNDNSFKNSPKIVSLQILI